MKVRLYHYCAFLQEGPDYHFSDGMIKSLGKFDLEEFRKKIQEVDSFIKTPTIISLTLVEEWEEV